MIGIYLALDLFFGGDDGATPDDYQAVARFRSDAVCEECLEAWDGRISTRPVFGAFVFISPSDIENAACRHHLEMDEFVAICPMPEGWEPK
jgi:hypothetical protein